MPAASPLRILLADDHEMILDMLEIHLTRSPDFAVIKARSLTEALAVIGKEGPFDLVLLDWQMPGMNGLEGLRRTIAGNGGRGVAILTGAPVRQLVTEILDAGAVGVVLKSTPLRSLTNAIRFMQSGEVYLPMELMRAQAAPAGGLLSETELTVLAGLAAGRQNKEIALDIGLAEPTVKMHVTAICRKLEARNRTQAVVRAGVLGLT